MRRVVRAALSGGWQWDGWSGTTHARITWPATGEVLSFGATPSVASWKTLATEIRRVSGVEVWRKGNRKRSRKAPQVSGFDPSATYRSAASSQVADLIASWRRYDDALAALEALGALATRDQIAEARRLIEQRAEVEEALHAHHQPTPRRTA